MWGLEYVYIEFLWREDLEVDEDINFGWKVFFLSVRIYFDLFNNYVSFIGMRWDCCLWNCLVGLVMKVSVVVYFVCIVVRKKYF